jgi:hypothetical protein
VASRRFTALISQLGAQSFPLVQLPFSGLEKI